MKHHPFVYAAACVQLGPSHAKQDRKCSARYYLSACSDFPFDPVRALPHSSPRSMSASPPVSDESSHSKRERPRTCHLSFKQVFIYRTNLFDKLFELPQP